MGQKFLIDSNIIIEFLKGSLSTNGMTLVAQAINSTPYVSVVSKIEVLGFNAPSNEEKLLKEFFKDAQVLPLSDQIVNKTIDLRKTHKRKLPDMIIAATALIHQLDIISRNTKDFNNIAELTVIDPHNFSIAN